MSRGDVMMANGKVGANADLEMSDDEFRQVVRSWIENNYPLAVRNSTRRVPFEIARPWYTKLQERGWLAPGWPVEYGGQGFPIIKRLILLEELERFGAVRLNDIGVTMIGPLIIKYGTDEQRARFLPRILSGDHVWCQGYSESNAGSDLASLRTEATKDGNEWVINGEKIWTTRGANSNWMFGLFRTSHSGRKQEGISFLLVPMDSEGLTVRPIRDISGDEELCQTLFENVRVPLDNLVGEVGNGWQMANALLGLERVTLGSPKHSENALAQLARLMERNATWEDAAITDRFVQLQMDLEDHTTLYKMFVDRLRRGDELGSDVSILKINQTELYQRITDMMLTLAHEYAGLSGPIPGTDIAASEQYLVARPTTIFGGTSEIQRNILATKVLGLPR
jgi:alkylation response protein AidB-like acyl-CoA dehydrogenase